MTVDTSRQTGPVSAQADRIQPRTSSVLGLLLALTLLAAAAMIDPSVGALFYALATCAVVSAGISMQCVRVPLDRTTLPFIGNVALLIMFGLHPIAMVMGGVIDEAFHFNFDLRATYALAVALGFCATLAFNLGALLGRFGGIEPRLPSSVILRPQFDGDAQAAAGWGWALVVLALGGYSIFAISTGQNPVQAILAGARQGGAGGSTAYFYLAPLLLGPAALLLLYSAMKARKRPVGALVVVALEVGLFLPGGQRIVLILAVLPVLLAWFMLTQRRLPTTAILAIGAVVFLLFVSLRDVGTIDGPSLTETLQGSFSDPANAAMETLTGDDSEMVDSIAILTQAVPEQIPHEPLRAFTALIASPIPSALWPDKPQPMDSTVNQLLMGTRANSAGLAYSLAGEFYFDGGFAAAITGFAVLGFVCARLTKWYRLAHHATTLLIYASLSGALINLLRGSLTYTFARLLFTVVPLLLFAVYTRSRARRERPLITSAGVRKASVTTDG